MKQIKYIITALVAIALLLGFQSCFQDMDDNPPLNFPAEYVPESRALKFHLAFDGNLDDTDNHYRVKVASSENITFVDGIKGKAYVGGNTKFAKVNMIALSTDQYANIGSYTVAFWMNLEGYKGASSLFTIANKEFSQGNVDIWLDNYSGLPGDAFFKGYMRTVDSETGKEKTTWIDVKNSPEGSAIVSNTYGKWSHMAFRYNGNTSEFSIFRDGEVVLNKRKLGTFGPLVFKKETLSSIVIGGFGFQGGASNPGVSLSWAGPTYQGLFDEYRFYTDPISDAEIKALYDKKE